MGLLDDLRDAGTPVTSKVVFRYGGDPKVIDVGAGGDVDGLYSPRRTVLDRILVDAAVEAGADVLHGVSVTGLMTTNGRVSGVELGGGRGCVEATWVIGADGLRSRVAAQVGARTIREEAATTSDVYAYWTGLPDNVIDNHFNVAGRAAGEIPTNEGEACVWVAMQPDRFREQARRDLRGLYHRTIGASRQLTEALGDATCTGGYRAFAGVRVSSGRRTAPVGRSSAMRVTSRIQ